MQAVCKILPTKFLEEALESRNRVTVPYRTVLAFRHGAGRKSFMLGRAKNDLPR